MNKIKTMLAFAAVLLCGGAWAITPVVMWDHDFDTESKVGSDGVTYNLALNGNVVAADGALKIDSTAGSNKGAYLTVDNDGNFGQNVMLLIKYSNLEVPTGAANVMAGIKDSDGNKASIRMGGNGQKNVKGCIDAGNYNGFALAGLADGNNVRTSGYVLFCYATQSGLAVYSGTSLASMAGGVGGGLHWSNRTIKTLGIGGSPETSVNTNPSWNNLKIESIALFKTTDAVSSWSDSSSASTTRMASFSFDKAMLYCLHLEGNADNSGTAGSAKISTTGTPTWVTDNGKFGAKCVKTNSGSYTIYDENGIATFDQGWTISYWVNSKDVPAWKDICAFRTGNMVWKHEPTGDSAFQFYGGVAGASSLSDGWSLGDAADGISKQAWNHVAIVSGADKASFDVYVNGVKKQSRGAVSGTNVWGTDGKAALTGFTIGLDGVPDGRKNNGLVDEVSIFNFAATPTQVGLLASQKPSEEAFLDGRDLALAIVKNGEINNANPHLLMHLDASNEESFELDGANVSKWKDLSSNARHATPADARVNSAWSTTKATRETVAGRAVVNMGATGSGIDLSFTRMTNIRTVIFAMSIEQNANAFFLGDNGNNVYPFHRGGSGQYAMNNAVFGNNRDSNVWCDGVAKRPTLDTPPTDCHIYTIELGADGTANRLSQDRDINGRNGGRAISEMLVFDRVLTPSERVAVESYLSKKWNISPVVPPQLSRKVIAANFGADYTTIPATVDTQFPLVSLPGSAWTQTRTGSNTSGISIDVIDPMTLAATGESATLKWASSGTYRENGGSEKSSALTNGYIDDAAHDGTSGATINFEQIPFDSYDVVIVGATDGGSRTFRAVAITAGNAAEQKYTFADGVTKVGDSNWGESYYRVPEEGKNALVIKGLTGATLTIQGGSNADSSRGGIAAVMIIDASEKVWTNGTGDGNWNTAGNWAMGRVPTAEDDVIINTPATISFTTASTVKSIAINDDVTFKGSIADGTIKNITIADGKILTVDVAQGVEDKIRGIKGGTVVKKGAGALSFNNGNSDKALDGTLVKIDQGKVLANCDNGDAVLQDPTFIIGENGELDNYGWFTVNGTLTVESNFDKRIFTNVGRNNTGIKGFTSFVKKGTGNVKLMAWKANERSEKCAIDAAIEIQAGRLTFYPHGSGYTVNGTITGAGSVGVIAGSDTSHYVILGGNNVNNSYTGGTVVESGTLGLGFKNALGGQGKTLLVEAGATVDVRGIVDHGSVCTLNGGTIKNSTSDCGRGSVQFRSIELTADSIVDLAYATGIINNSYDATSIKLNGFKLTKKGSAALYLVSVTTANTGTLRLEAGSIHFMGGDQTYPANKAPATSQMSLEVAGSNVGLPGNYALTFANVSVENNCSLDAGTAALTVNGTLKAIGSIAKATTVASTGTLDLSMAEENSIASHITGNLTIAIGAKLIFPTDYVENTPITLTAGTLAATSGSGQVSTDGGETFVPATVTYDVEAKTVKYVTALNEYALTDADIAAIEAKNITLGGAGIIQVATETDIAKSCTFTNVPEGYTVYGLGGKFIGVVKMNYEAEKEEVLNTAALHFDASRLNTIAAGQDNAVTAWDNLGADTTRPNATVKGNGRAANNSPTLAASSNSIAIDFGECNSQMDLGWARIGGIKAVIQVIDIKADKRAFLFGDYNNGSGVYSFHRGQQNSNPYYFNNNSRIAKVYDNGVDKGNGQSQVCSDGLRVISLTATRNDVYSDCFTTDRDNCDNRSGGRKLCEVLVFTEVLTDAKRVEIEDYLLRKWFNAKAVVNGVPKSSIQDALNAVEDGDYTAIHMLVAPTAEEIPDGWCWKNGAFARIYAMVNETGFASIEDAVASLEGAAGTVKVVKRATADLASAPANAAYTLEYTKGMGAENARYYLPYASAGASVTLSSATEADVYYTKETVSGNATTINMNNAIVNFGDIFSIGQATYNLTGTTKVTAPRLILSQGYANRTATLNMSGSAKLTVTGNNCVDSNQSTIMFGHYNGPSTFTISESAQFIAENAWVLVGKTANTQIINIQGGTFTAKGIKVSGGASNNNQLNISGGELRLGDAGITKNGGAMTTTVSGNATITATAATMPLELPMTVNDGVTLSIAGETIEYIDISNITLGENSVLDLTGCTALKGINYGTLRDFSSVSTDKIRLPDGACYVVVPTQEEYANGISVTITNVPEDTTVKIKVPGSASLLDMTRDGTTLTHNDGVIRVSGYATWLDYTFTKETRDDRKSNQSYIENAGSAGKDVTLKYDTNYTANDSYNEENGTLYAKSTPWRDMSGDYAWPSSYTVAVCANVPDVENGCLMAFGSSSSSSGKSYVAIVRGPDGNTIRLMKGTDVNTKAEKIVDMRADNATTSKHLIVFTNDGTKFKVYCDGTQLEERSAITLGNGFQIGSVHGGVAIDANHAGKDYTGITRVSEFPDDKKDGCEIKAIRVFNKVISTAEMDALVAEFPYISKGGLYTRTISSAATLSATDAWADSETQTPTDLPESTTIGGVTYKPSLKITTTTESRLTLNATLAAEQITFEGDGELQIYSEGENKLSASGKVTVNGPIAFKHGLLDISASPLQIGAKGSMKIDVQDIVDLEDVGDDPVKIQLTGMTDEAQGKVSLLNALNNPNYTAELVFEEKHYWYVVTMINKVLVIPTKDNTTPTATIQVGEDEPEAVEIVNGQIAAPLGSTVVVTYTPNTGYFADENGVVTIESVGATSTVTAPEMPTLVKGQASVTVYTSAQDPGTTTYYKTLAQAVSVADDDAAVNLEDNVALDETFVIEKNLYLNLAAYSLSCSDAAIPVLRVARECIVQIDTLSTGNITSESVAVENNGTFIVWAGSITGNVVLNWIADPLEQNQPMAWDYTQDVAVTAGVATKDVGNDIYRVTMNSTVIPLPETSYPGMGHLITAVTKEEPAKPTDDEPTVIDDPEEKVAMEPGAKVIIPETMPVENVKVVYGGIDLAKEVVDSEGAVARPKYVEVSRDADTGAVVLTTTDAAKPAATAIAMATPTEGEGEEATDKVQFTITNPIPGLFYEIVSGDSFDEDGALVVDHDAEKGTSQATTSAEAKTVSIPMTFTGDKKVKYYKVSVKATK